MEQLDPKALPVPDPRINPSVYYFLPPAEAQYQLEHINETRVSALVSSHIICLVIAYIAVFLRFLSRRINNARHKLDDWLMLLGLVFFTVYIAMVLLVVFRYGGGKHSILLKDPISFAKAVLVAEILYAPAIGLVKCSTLALYGSIFNFPAFHRAFWAIAFVIAAASTANILSIIFQCRPISGAWDPIVRFKAHCIELDKVIMFLAGINVLTDFTLLAIPLPHVYKLKVAPAAKAQLIGLFGIGFFVTAVSIYRLVILQRVNLVDGSWTNVGPTIWTVVEVSIAMLCASAITYRPLFNFLLGIKPARAHHNDSPRHQQGQQSHERGGPKPERRAVRGFWSGRMSSIGHTWMETDGEEKYDKSRKASSLGALSQWTGVASEDSNAVFYRHMMQVQERELRTPTEPKIPPPPLPSSSVGRSKLQQVQVQTVEVHDEGEEKRPRGTRDLETGSSTPYTITTTTNRRQGWN